MWADWSQVVSLSCLTIGWLLAERPWFSYTSSLLQQASLGLFSWWPQFKKGLLRSRVGICRTSLPSPYFRRSKLQGQPSSVVGKDVPPFDERGWKVLLPFLQSTVACVEVILPSGLISLEVSMADNVEKRSNGCKLVVRGHDTSLNPTSRDLGKRAPFWPRHFMMFPLNANLRNRVVNASASEINAWKTGGKKNSLCYFCELYPEKEEITTYSTPSLPNSRRTTMKHLDFGWVRLLSKPDIPCLYNAEKYNTEENEVLPNSALYIWVVMIRVF